MAKIVADAWLDPSHYTRFVENPLVFLREGGFDLCGISEVIVIENQGCLDYAVSGGTATIKLPSFPDSERETYLGLSIEGMAIFCLATCT